MKKIVKVKNEHGTPANVGKDVYLWIKQVPAWYWTAEDPECGTKLDSTVHSDWTSSLINLSSASQFALDMGYSPPIKSSSSDMTFVSSEGVQPSITPDNFVEVEYEKRWPVERISRPERMDRLEGAHRIEGMDRVERINRLEGMNRLEGINKLQRIQQPQELRQNELPKHINRLSLDNRTCKSQKPRSNMTVTFWDVSPARKVCKWPSKIVYDPRFHLVHPKPIESNAAVQQWLVELFRDPKKLKFLCDVVEKTQELKDTLKKK